MNQTWKFITFGFFILCISGNTIGEFVPRCQVVRCVNGSTIVGGTGQIFCDVQCYPEPSIIFQKTYDLRHVQRNKQRFKIDVEPMAKKYWYNVTVTISDANVTDSGTYEIIAGSDVSGGIGLCVEFEVQYIPPTRPGEVTPANMPLPKPPGIPTITNAIKDGKNYVKVNSTNEIELTWQIPPNNGLDIERYRITYCLGFENHYVKDNIYYVGNTCKDIILNRNEIPSAHVIKNLNPGCYYFVMITAFNAAGEGPPSELYFKTDGHYEPPYYRTRNRNRSTKVIRLSTNAED